MMLALSVIVPIAIAVVVVLLVVIAVLWRRRHRGDTVAAFQRHIDALSPEARRPVVDKVQQIEEERGEANGGADSDGS